MRLPSNIKLHPQQEDRFHAWVEKQRKPTMEQHDEMYGGASLTSSFVWTCRVGSIEDEVKVENEFTREILDLTIDDDGVMVCDYKPTF